MAAATDYLHSVDERTNCSCINSTFDVFFLFIKFMSFISFINYKKKLKNHKLYLIKILVFLCELQNHFVSHHF